MATDMTIVATLGALVSALVGMQWFLIRDMRRSLDRLQYEISDLTLILALDVATRPSVNPTTRATARRLVQERDAVRAREIEEQPA